MNLVGFLTVAWLVLTGTAGCLLISFSLVFFLPISRPLYRKFNDLVGYCWFCTPLFFIELICGTKIQIFTDDGKLPAAKPSLVISNHRTRLDWMYLWSFFLRIGTLSHEKIVLKAGLKKAPIFGWCTQAFRFLFLERQLEKDRDHMIRVMKSYVVEKYPISMLLFPEGTDLSQSNLELSHKFSAEKGLRKYEHVLHPRTKGFTTCFQELRKENHVSSVLDLTLAYPDVVPQGEKHLFNGEHPREIHIRVRQFDSASLPSDDAALAKWVVARFDEKESELAIFEMKKTFESGTLVQNLFATKVEIFLINIGWLALIGLEVFAALYLPFAGLFFIGLFLAIMGIASFSGGIDIIELGWVERDHNVHKKLL